MRLTMTQFLLVSLHLAAVLVCTRLLHLLTAAACRQQLGFSLDDPAFHIAVVLLVTGSSNSTRIHLCIALQPKTCDVCSTHDTAHCVIPQGAEPT